MLFLHSRRARAHPPLARFATFGCAALGRLRGGGECSFCSPVCFFRSTRRTRREAPAPRHPSVFWPVAVSVISPDAFLMSSRHQWTAREMPNEFVWRRMGRALVSFSSSKKKKNEKKTTVACGIFRRRIARLWRLFFLAGRSRCRLVHFRRPQPKGASVRMLSEARNEPGRKQRGD